MRSVLASPADGLPAETRRAYRDLYAHWRQRGFHCADAVLADVSEVTIVPAAARDAVTAFLGGTVFTGMTCSALTAGVMALGLALGEIEDSRLRVLRMIATMAVRGDAFADDVNAFNRVMNLGQALAGWFETQFGSTQCASLTGCDFARGDGVHAYIEHDGTAECSRIADLVAARVRQILATAASPT